MFLKIIKNVCVWIWVLNEYFRIFDFINLSEEECLRLICFLNFIYVCCMFFKKLCYEFVYVLNKKKNKNLVCDYVFYL